MDFFSHRIKQHLQNFSKGQIPKKIPTGKRAILREMKDLLVIQDAAMNGDQQAAESITRIREINSEIDAINARFRRMNQGERTKAILTIYLISLEKVAIINRFDVPRKKAKIYMETFRRNRREELTHQKTNIHGNN